MRRLHPPRRVSIHASAREATATSLLPIFYHPYIKGFNFFFSLFSFFSSGFY